MKISGNYIAQTNAFIPNSRLSWVGKERDVESNLGDYDTSVHGVRKYEPESGRFLSIDPLWEKYYAWTPYQYSMNDPVNKVDVDGKKFVMLGSTNDIKEYNSLIYDIYTKSSKGREMITTLKLLNEEIICQPGQPEQEKATAETTHRFITQKANGVIVKQFWENSTIVFNDKIFPTKSYEKKLWAMIEELEHVMQAVTMSVPDYLEWTKDSSKQKYEERPVEIDAKSKTQDIMNEIFPTEEQGIEASQWVY